ncbi:DUF4359 domain-containing protein [Ectobacillus panaciterrae]|uniref:DUF4359 domain-containing protein n=1 Tax=Ectobacillus panaciterrae TaxID=363872 RepID=UPI0003FE3264|nr:DUF4359 domain-containing protein [Ectobacillus panaciterrae]
MRWRYLSLALLIGTLLYLANTNPEKGQYTAWASQQFVENTDVHHSLTDTEKENGGFLGELAAFGRQLTEKYVEPQVGLIIDKYTKQEDYIFFSTYKTEFTVGSTTYKYMTIGVAGRFFLVEAPKNEKAK